MVSVNNRAVATLRYALEGLPHAVEVAPARGAAGPAVDVRYGTSTSRLVPVWAGTGYPQDVLRALRELEDICVAPEETPVLAVREMSRGAVGILRERGASWVDERGHASISAPPALVVSRGASVRHAAPSKSAELRWSEGSGAIAEYLLTVAQNRGEDPPVELPSGAQIARDVGLSAGFVSRTLNELDAMGWTAKTGARRGATASRRLVDPTEMLSSWARWHSHRSIEAVLAHALFGDPIEFVREKLAPALEGVSWAVTGWLALDRRAPFATSTPRVTIYVDPSATSGSDLMNRLFLAADLREVDRGARVAIVTSDPHVLATAHADGDLPLVSDIRLYGDLLREGARGPDAAEHLRAATIGF